MAMLDACFSSKFRSKLGAATLYLAIALFVVHLGLTEVAAWMPGWSQMPMLSNPINAMLSNPINAIYTPFSVLLIYEGYFLAYSPLNSWTSTTYSSTASTPF